jgi:hypothetical protein
MRIVTKLTVCALGATVAATGFAQERRPSPDFGGEAIIYRDRNYSGPAVNVSRPQPNLGLAWTVGSIRVRSGRWELCSGVNFGGRCATVDRDTPDLYRQIGALNRVASMRAVPSPITPVPPAPGNGASLRGMAAEFFPAPARRGQRVPACQNGAATANCAARTADRFCKQEGWNGSKSEALQTVGRGVYLADVLCVRSGF